MDQMQPTKRGRGRPPKGETAMDGPTRQRLYIERKVLALASATPAPAPTLDKLGRDPLQVAKDEAAYLRNDRDRWQADCLKAEGEIKLLERQLLNATKDKIVLQQEIAALKSAGKPAKGRQIR